MRVEKREGYQNLDYFDFFSCGKCGSNDEIKRPLRGGNAAFPFDTTL